MLTVKAPLEIKAKTSYLRDPESFYYRILGNYSLMETPVAGEDLLHIAATPPEIYVTEGEGISNFLSTSVRNESNYNKVQILNNVLNRIIVSADMDLTYQDRVFITDALYKLGVKDDRKFMNAFYKMAEETRNTNALINLYFEQGQDIKAMVETFSSKSEKEKTSETRTVEKEQKNYLYNTILDRLSTGAVYQIVSNFNRSVDYNEIDRNEYSLSAQTYTAGNILLSVLRERAGFESKTLTLLNRNTYEESIENVSEDVTNVQNQISSAVMMDLLQNIYRVGFEKFITDQDMYYRFEDTFYKSSDQVIQRLLSSYGTSISRRDINEFLIEENSILQESELRLFGYSRQNEYYEADVRNIENLLQQIDVTEKNLETSYAEYQLRRYDYSYDVHPTEKKTLRQEVLNVLQLLGENQDAETLQLMTAEVSEAQGNAQRINEILNEYLSAETQMSFDTDISTVIEGSREIYELLQVIGNAEDTGEAIEAAKKLKEQVNISENFTRIIDDYLMFFTNTEKIAAADLSPMVFSSRTLELVQLLSEKPEEEPDEDTLGRIREIVRKSELYDKGVKERIYELAAGEAGRREGISEGKAVSSEAGERISQLINTENVSELSFENINEVRNLILRNSVASERIIKDRMRELLTEEGPQIAEISPEEAAVLDKAGAAIIEYLSNENINEISFENTQQLKEIVRKSTQLSLKEKEKLLETVTAGQVRMLKQAQTETEAENELKQELITLIQETGKVSVSEPVAERIKTIISSLSGSISKYNLFFEEETRHIERERKTAVERILATKEFDSILEQTITEYENENPEDREKTSDRAVIRQEVIRILRAGKPEEILTGAAAEIQKIYTSLQSNIQNYRVTSATNEPGQEIAGSAEEIAVLGKKIAGETPSTIIYESSPEEPEEEETKVALVIKKDELVKLIRDYRTSESRETVKTSEVRDIINQIQISGEKQRAAAFPGGTGYVEAKKPQEPEIVPKESPEETAEAEPFEEKGKEKAVSDEDIRKLTESVNRINVENELRRRQYLETVRNFESRKPKQSQEDALSKTRKRAIMALESPETLRETLESERVVKENREKEILKELQGIFPDQSMEIYQLFNRYQSNPEQLYEENILRPAEVGELLFDINDATRAPAEREEQSVAKILAEAVSELPKESERVKALIRQEEAAPSRTPAETVHKFTETLSSDELNEQLEMMRHNLTRQIKEEVKSDVVTESHNVNAKEVVTTDNTTQQISQVNIQRMIDNTVRSEMNTISNQVMSKIERQMRNEKIRRGY